MARYGSKALAQELRARLRVPVVVGPMFLVSGPELVIGCSRAGVIGSFPTLNARTTGILDTWLSEIRTALAQAPSAAPYAANLIVHSSNARLMDDVDLVVHHKVEIVIASVGNPASVIPAIKGYGGIVFSDVASIKHAQRAAEAGVDGLILLCAGSGGNTGWLNPFGFLAEVRAFFDGPVVLAGAISNGHLVNAAEKAGADFAYMGTSFIATHESMASAEYQQMLLESNADDVKLTTEVTGIPSNMLRKSLERVGFKPDKAHADAGFSIERELQAFKAWKDIWSAGHGVGGVQNIESTADLVERLRKEYLMGPPSEIR
ncbi:MAG: nitronate monooxygenase [Ectothiorhodospiraceae bacterium]|nr:nitronate monooxygenase [Ectothiorhodospiraceae bacterium]